MSKTMRELRLSIGLSTRQAAKKAGLARQTVIKSEQGAGDLSELTIAKLSSAYKVSPGTIKAAFKRKP